MHKILHSARSCYKTSSSALISKFVLKSSVNLGYQKKEIGPVTVVALITHHTATSTSFNDTSWNGKGNLLF
jgi:hypothetical protein